MTENRSSVFVWQESDIVVLKPKTNQLFNQGGLGSGFKGHAGRPGQIGGSTQQGTGKVTTTKKYHNVVSDEGMWGHSHSQSSMISGEAAARMGIEGYHVETDERLIGNRKIFSRVSDKFLQAISDDEIGAEETLYHGFQNTRQITFKEGDTFKIPLTATTGDMDGAVGYGIRLDRRDQQGAPTVFIFPEGTSMAAYSKWNNEDAKEFGYKYSEAIVAGEFRITSSIFQEMDSPQHDSRPGESWHKTTIVNVVTLEPISIFDTDTNRWRK